MPTVSELQTILLAPYPCGTSPCIDPIFGVTASNNYWSSTTYAGHPTNAWVVKFDDGFVFTGAFKGIPLSVRAVRGAL